MQLVLEVPDYFTIDYTATELVDQVKLYAALIMFKSGQISAGAACEFAGIDRYAFLAACKKYNIDAVDYDENELDKEIKLNTRKSK